MSLGFSILAIPLPLSLCGLTRESQNRVLFSQVMKSSAQGCLARPAVLPPSHASHEPIVPHDAQILVALQQKLI
jgi:hypothetical protein